MAAPSGSVPIDLAQLIGGLPDAVVVADGTGHIVAANPVAERLLAPAAGMVGQPLSAFVPVRYRDRHLAGFNRYLATGESRLVNGPAFRVSALRGDGVEVEVELVLGSVGAAPPGPGALLLGTLRDVSDRVALEREVDLARYLRAGAEVATRLHQASDVDQAYREVLPALCASLDWDVAGLWLLDPAGAALTCVDVWRVGLFESETFERASREMRAGPGVGLPGRCWSAGAPVQIAVGDPLVRLPRLAEARQSGLRRAVAFPLVGSAGLSGVVELFRTRDVPVDPHLLDLLGSIGRQLGQFLDRVRAESALGDRAALLTSALDAAAEGVLAVSPQRTVLAVNRRFFELWGFPEDLVRPGDPSPAFLAATQDQVVDPAGFLAALDWGHGHPDEEQRLDVPLRDGRVIEGYAAPIVDGHGAYHGRVWFLRDDTERRATEAARATLLAQLQQAQRAQDFLLRASEVLAAADGYAETMHRLAGVAVPTLGDVCLIDVIDDQGELVRMVARHADPRRQPLVDRLRRHYPPDPAGAHPAADAIRSGRSSWSAEMTDEFLRATSRDEHHFTLVKQLGFSSYMTVPLLVGGESLGSITLVATGHERRFDAADLSLAEELARRVALVVAKARRYDQELHTSHTLQASLLPAELPSIPGLSVAARYLPGTTDVEVGGDFYDVLLLPEGEVAFAVGDVAGHDITAAAAMGQLRSVSRGLVGRSGGPGGLIRLLHEQWPLLGIDRIATAVFGRLRPADGVLRLASAGHPPPLIIADGDGRFADLDVGGPFGAPPTGAGEWTTRFRPGSAVVCYTDGLVEHPGGDIEDGMRTLRQVAAGQVAAGQVAAGQVAAGEAGAGRGGAGRGGAGRGGADELADRILAEMVGVKRTDDIALLVMVRDR